jgi:hypothetical protein
VEAKRDPSGEKAMAMVERGGGPKGQYAAVQLLRKSDSTQSAIATEGLGLVWSCVCAGAGGQACDASSR